MIAAAQCGTAAYAGESADIAADAIINGYYPALSDENAERILAIAGGTNTDDEKIKSMCELLDSYSDYVSYEAASQAPRGGEWLEHTIGKLLYIKIDRFMYGVDDEFLSLLEKYPRTPLALDLSECSGGITTVMENIAKAIVPGGIIYTSRFTDGEQSVYSELSSGVRHVIVITSAATASCAEILAAALRESGVGLVIGERTYGKSSIQNMRTLPNGGALRFTVGHWYTRDGADIGGTGIAPDIALGSGWLEFLKSIWEVS
jgi:C-terminal processing protease CtpA/Prc